MSQHQIDLVLKLISNLKSGNDVMFNMYCNWIGTELDGMDDSHEKHALECVFIKKMNSIRP